MKHTYSKNKKFGNFVDMMFYLQKVTNPSAQETFWSPKMDEILEPYLSEIQEHPEDAANILKAYAWHAYVHALRQR